MVSTENRIENREFGNEVVAQDCGRTHVSDKQQFKQFDLTEFSLIIVHTGGVQTQSQVQKYTGFNCIGSKSAVQLKLTLLEVDWAF